MSKRIFSILLGALLFGASVQMACANGDPVSVRSAITLSPTPVAVHVPEVQLVDEVVSFVPRDRYMEVTVRYLFHNRSARSFDKLPYGFPIDYFGSGEARWESLDDMSESEQEVGWRDDYIHNVCFTMNGRQLSWQCSRDSIIMPESKEYAFDAFLDIEPDSAGGYSKRIVDSLYALYGEEIYYYNKPVSRRWFYTYLSIPANSFVTLEVRYAVECVQEGTLYPRNNNFIDHIYDLSFQYDFTPAAYWGDGYADHFSVILDASEINLVEGDFSFAKTYYNFKNGFSGIPLQQKGKLWQYETRRFDLASAKPFTVFYTLPRLPNQPLDRILNHRIDPSAYTVEVSGADGKYPVSNLSDLEPATACVLRPDKNDSLYIIIRFKNPTVLEGLLLLNGYTKSAETYRNNSRIDSLLVFADRFDVFDDGEKKHTTSPDKNIMLLGNVDHWIVKYTDFVPAAAKIPGKMPKTFDWQSLVDNAMQLNLSFAPFYDTHYTEIRIVISATEKGLKYDDLCVSEILLIGK